MDCTEFPVSVSSSRQSLVCTLFFYPHPPPTASSHTFSLNFISRGAHRSGIEFDPQFNHSLQPTESMINVILGSYFVPMSAARDLGTELVGEDIVSNAHLRNVFKG